MGNAASGEFISGAAALRAERIADVSDAHGADAAGIWAKLFPEHTLPALELFSVIQPEHVREMRSRAPRNLAMAIIKAVDILEECISAPAAKGYPRMLNAVRLLTRLLPIVFEDYETAQDDFVHQLFWENALPSIVMVPELASEAPAAPSAVATAAAPSEAAHVTADGASTDAAASDAAPPAPAPPAAAHKHTRLVPALQWTPRQGEDAEYPLGVRLVHCAMAALFLPDLTIEPAQYEIFVAKMASSRTSAEGGAAGELAPGNTVFPRELAPGDTVFPDEANAVWPMLLWSGGVGFPGLHPPWNAAWNGARVDVLHLLLVLSSQTLYSPPLPQRPARSRFLDELVSSSCPFAPTLFYCLLNAVAAYDPVGWGVPYATAMMGDKDEALVNASIQVLLVLLDYAPLVERAREPGAPPADEAEPQMYAQFNMYRSMLAGLTDPGDFDIIYSAIGRLLGSVPKADGSLLPYSLHQAGCYQELLVLLWKLCDENSAFLQHILVECDITEVVAPVLYLMWSGRSNVTRVGLLHLATFLLLLLSGSRAFGVGLNKQFHAKALPTDLPLLEGSHADLLIVVLHRVVVDGSSKLSTLFSCFLTIIANISPYTKALSLVASVKLLNLFELFSSPRFLFARPGNYVFAQQLLETFNNMIQYQYESNPVLVYALLRRHEIFEAVTEMSMDTWRKLDQTTATAGASGGSASARKALTAPLPPKEAAAASPPSSSSSAAGTGLVAAPGTTQAAGEGEAPTVPGPEGPAAITAQDAGSSSNGALVALADATTAPPAAAAASSSALVGGTPGRRGALPRGLGSPGAAGGHWVPTAPWLEGVLRSLPINTILRLVEYLSPLVERHVKELATDDEGVLDFLRATTLVGIVPQPHPIVQRVYQPNIYTSLWFSTLLWSTIFMRACKDLPMFDAEAIRLFQVTVV